MKWVKGLALMAGVVSLAACGNEQADEVSEDNPLNVVATTSMIADLMETIGGENVSVEGLMGPGVDPHDYQPSTSDVNAMSEADIVAYNGLMLEERFVEVFEQLDERGVFTIVMADALNEGELLDPEEDEENLEYDPHIWFSVSHWETITAYAADQLSEKDPDNEDYYQENAEAYLVELGELRTYIEERIEEVPEQSRYLVTAHDAFQYFGEEFNFEVVGLQGLNTQTEAGTGDISQLADFLVDNEINAVFVESSVSPRNIEALIEAAGSRGHEVVNAGELYSDALGSEEDDAETYLKMYRANIDTIVDGLAD
ncbi:metal ABC transporter solute-binding protein, Zn/Mn family [Alkalibacterium pelagium]|uniref:Manganese/zinc/iron transport system substrate-binding protein n=1 Tax=Alkalibacterium pelagium TaxID=426702 RepID=A0A1H7LH61_9LACT|nr:zinc ABC transporter substrate-binding protein [Alkalibacterium pelagium]GEN50883.1 manganese transporter [Alkalibacterium pelagium]SEK98226.1 manganese/zinc/iron transport system substrate-binding protein [Alkalibacterium pelagium]